MPKVVVDMSDVMHEFPDRAMPSDSQGWMWCQFAGHWYQQDTMRGAAGKRMKTCHIHRDQYNREYNRRRRVAIAEQMERTQGAGRNGGFSRADFKYFVLHSHTWVTEKPMKDGCMQAQSMTTMNFPMADEEIACGCVPGWPHGELCGDGLTGTPCRQPD